MGRVNVASCAENQIQLGSPEILGRFCLGVGPVSSQSRESQATQAWAGGKQ